MASFLSSVLREGRGAVTDETKKPIVPVTSRRRPAPVRVRLQRINADRAKPFPPDGEARAWWDRLKTALGTTSSAFVNSSLIQLQAAARLPCSGISEMAVNAALAMIEAVGPKDEIEGALQMACTHTAAMAVLARLGGGHGTEQRVAALGSAAARLLRAYSAQVEVLRRLRHGGGQYVRVEHVHISGGQAVIGNVKTSQVDHDAPPRDGNG
jgi:hypothetical protein